MEKVFRKQKFIASTLDNGIDIDLINAALKLGWVQKCEGKTEEEIEKMGYRVMDEWMVEEDE